jgi:hypothetical protein
MDGGVIFKINTDGTEYTNLHSFAGGTSDGSRPFGSLLNYEDGFYGMTFAGGVSNFGVVFMYSEIPEPYFIWIVGLIPFFIRTTIRLR